MRKGVEVRLGQGDRERLEVIIGTGNVMSAPAALETSSKASSNMLTRRLHRLNALFCPMKEDTPVRGG